MSYGVSAYFSDLDTAEEVCARAAKDGFELLFGSLRIPEEDPGAHRANLRRAARLAEAGGLRLVLDASAESLAHLGMDLDSAGQLAHWGVHGLRVGGGIEPPEIARLSRQVTVYLNAGTATADFLDGLEEAGVDRSRTAGLHNYYPKPGTGLSADLLRERNALFRQRGLAVSAFVPGDGVLRAPLRRGLPTVERHRGRHPLASALELRALGTDHVYIGDPSLAPRTALQWRAFVLDGVVELTAVLDADLPHAVRVQLNHPWRDRPDSAEAVIRLDGSRQALADVPLPPRSTVERPVGAITLDNDLSPRYRGELAVQRAALPPDPTVNVIGHVAPYDLPLLDDITSHLPLRFG